VDWLSGNRPLFSDPDTLGWHSHEWRLQGKALIENRLRAILRIGPVKRRLDRKSRSGRFELESQTLADF